MIEETNQETKVVNILPLKKGKRILLFLADFFLNFILAFLLMNVVVTPIAKAVTKFSSKNETYTLNLTNRAEILYGNKLLFDSKEVDRSEIVYNTSFTLRCYLSYFCFEEESPSVVSYSQYGHKEENDIFKTYFINILNDEDLLINLFDKYNKTNDYFIREGTNFTLKSEIMEQIRPYFVKNELPNQLGQAYFNNLEKYLFTPMNSEMMTLILKYDLTYNNLSYKAIHNEIKSFEKYFNNMMTYNSFITIFLSTFIMYFLIPILNKNKRTLGMMLMRIQRVNIYKLTLLKKYDLFMSFVYQFLFTFVIAFLIPIGYLTIFEIFKLTALLIFAMLSLCLMIGSLIFVLCNGYNRTLSDFVTRTVYLPNEELDEIYRAKGYVL